MRFATFPALLFPIAITAVAIPAGKPAAGDDQCLPVSYILSEYTLSRSSHYNYVSFNLQSSYTVDTHADDEVQAGANCEADGVEIHSNDNKCNIAGQKVDNLVFDLKDGSDDPSYRIHHEWQCNGATWTSVNEIELPPLDCETIEDNKDGKSIKCTSKPIIFAPQNARKLSDDDDEKKAAGKVEAAKPAVSHVAKPADCPKCKPSASL
ncbi:hypothetical protein OPT61_g6901 [Boeremia exigua]|uniref:Uncharacterized protein n=1 Tax=Boeremia exigua TaxID=749465 RepID=A0ACC2I5W3_9PLEO|nr:hypothetical protein OPT61_g6901 [Boeremia exigua]